jgi:hypothetical protein
LRHCYRYRRGYHGGCRCCRMRFLGRTALASSFRHIKTHSLSEVVGRGLIQSSKGPIKSGEVKVCRIRMNWRLRTSPGLQPDRRNLSNHSFWWRPLIVSFVQGVLLLLTGLAFSARASHIEALFLGAIQSKGLIEAGKIEGCL